MNDTTSFVLAFGSFWLGIVAYVAWLAWRARRLQRARR